MTLGSIFKIKRKTAADFCNTPYMRDINIRGGFAAGPLGLSVEDHVNFDKNLTMWVEKF